MPVTRRGRPPAAEREQRRAAALEAALAEIVEHGYAGLTMGGVAARAGSSKESLYIWFGSKPAMVAELIRRQSATTNEAVRRALATADRTDPREMLVDVAGGLLALLTGPVSLALNRAAMSAPELAADLLLHGRHTTGPLVERYLAVLHGRGVVHAPDPAVAFGLLYGLVVQDWQIRALLGERPLSARRRIALVEAAVDRFLALSAVPVSPGPAPG